MAAVEFLIIMENTCRKWFKPVLKIADLVQPRCVLQGELGAENRYCWRCSSQNLPGSSITGSIASVRSSFNTKPH